MAVSTPQACRLLRRRRGLGRLRNARTAGWLIAAIWYDALRVLPTAQVGSLLYLEPVVTVMVAAVVLKEPITLASIAGGAVIVGGVWVATRARH